MNPIYLRLAELRTIQKKRSLTKSEQVEFDMILDVNVSFCWKIAKFENFFTMAYQTNDIDWMHENSAKIEELKA